MAFLPIPAVASASAPTAFMSLFELHSNLEHRSFRFTTALTGHFSLQGSLPSGSTWVGTSCSGPTSPRGGVRITVFRTRSAFKNGLWVQFPLAFGFKAPARLKSLAVSSERCIQ